MIYVIGSGGHAKVVLDALLEAGTDAAAIGVRDGNPARAGQFLLGIAIATPELDEALSGADVHVAIGSSRSRSRLLEAAMRAGGRAATICHRAAVIAASARIGEGSFVAAQAVVGPDVEVGPGTIVNHGAVVDHDCRVGAFCHIAPHATLGGAVTVADHVLIGAGATVLPGINIGAGSVVGAGAVVVRDIGAGQQWVGVPAGKQADLKK